MNRFGPSSPVSGSVIKLDACPWWASEPLTARQQHGSPSVSDRHTPCLGQYETQIELENGQLGTSTFRASAAEAEEELVASGMVVYGSLVAVSLQT